MVLAVDHGLRPRRFFEVGLPRVAKEDWIPVDDQL